MSAICLSGRRTSRLRLALATASGFLIGLPWNFEPFFYFLVPLIPLLLPQQQSFQSFRSDSSEIAACTCCLLLICVSAPLFSIKPWI